MTTNPLKDTYSMALLIDLEYLVEQDALYDNEWEPSKEKAKMRLIITELKSRLTELEKLDKIERDN